MFSIEKQELQKLVDKKLTNTEIDNLYNVSQQVIYYHRAIQCYTNYNLSLNWVKRGNSLVDNPVPIYNLNGCSRSND